MARKRPTFKNEILDKLFLAAAQNPRAVLATLKIERIEGPESFETQFLVDRRDDAAYGLSSSP
jgi:uncharacterized protein (UPF0371 family)